MKSLKFITTFTLLLIFINNSVAQEVKEGQWDINSQSEVSEYKNTSKITGMFWITGEDVHDLSPLSNLTEVAALVIMGTDLSSLKGLENLSKVKYIHIENNPKLKNIALNSVEETNVIQIFDNPILEAVQFDKLKKITPTDEIDAFTYIVNNPNLRDCSVFIPFLDLTDFTIGNNGKGCNSKSDILETAKNKQPTVTDCSTINKKRKHSVYIKPGEYYAQSVVVNKACYSGSQFKSFSWISQGNSPFSINVEIYKGETTSGNPVYIQEGIKFQPGNFGTERTINFQGGKGSLAFQAGETYTFKFYMKYGNQLVQLIGDTTNGKFNQKGNFDSTYDLKYDIQTK
ncbi:receptor L domain-containing protein [Kordia jejudonensis]|uniref:hypothetical protein n=1 Tax=Kordia jejudonensis TaxID=1348245 RepID=UPI0006295DA6|nr:hypothetical protein [Kordia jejudonensis]